MKPEAESPKPERRLQNIFVPLIAAGALITLVLAGCAVGPNYQRPAALGTNAMPPSFSSPMLTNAAIWKPAQPSAHLPRGAWWKIFGDPELNRLELLATTNNQQLVAAFANLQQARALVRVARADLFPQVSADPSAIRQRISANQSAGAGVLQPRVDVQHLHRPA